MADTKEEELRRRVQHKIASRYLSNLNETAPDEPDESQERTKLSDELDHDTQKKFEKKFDIYQGNNSPYSIQNFSWLAASISVIYYSDLVNVILYNSNVNRVWFNIGLMCIVINASIAAFLIGWLCYVRKIPHTLWEKEHPAAIPTATACFVVGSVCMTVGLWPVWSFLTPMILFAVFMGVIVTIAMVPN